MTNNPTMQDVLRQFYPEYLDVYTPNDRQAKTVRHIMNCKKCYNTGMEVF